MLYLCTSNIHGKDNNMAINLQYLFYLLGEINHVATTGNGTETNPTLTDIN